ncbi:pyridoxal-dependent decarboxylase [Rhodopseudomonas sp. B29]|uniref:pyridoxal phosphate-dependent decarboxylase family protein n=1 Tax=Rhodopseudomonas sp. B29 TaxID=95607 RepID=UPI00034990C6|nr:pyridoxal-dependent decarboxylase [Rhodopseudomonas sp. B29]
MSATQRAGADRIESTSLDPQDWDAFRADAHRMLDDMIDYIAEVRERPVWQPMPIEVQASFRETLPRGATPLAEVYRDFTDHIAPYATGNVHPGFMGWVHGGGTAVGMLADMLAAGLNANCGGRNHVGIEVERQIVRWVRELFGFPETASGVFVTGSSMANAMALLVARTHALGPQVRDRGLDGAVPTAYASAAAHGCVTQAADLAGLGRDALRRIPFDDRHRMDIGALREQIAADRAAGLKPFLVTGSAGTVDVGAIDDLATLAELCRDEGLWFHVDGAFGSLGMLSPQIAPKLKGLSEANSVALDFHKWGQVNYDAGFLIVRDGEAHRATFAAPAAYLRRETRGLAAGSHWPCDYGPDLSRGFRALKTWFTLKTYGTERLGAMIANTCAVARHLEARVRREPKLELLAPVELNIVCFRHRDAREGSDIDAFNAAIVADLHESGIAAPSATTIDGKFAIRAAIVNHRTACEDVDRLVDAVLRFGAAREHK